jgi:mono/diheme cytochrome c family protein
MIPWRRLGGGWRLAIWIAAASAAACGADVRPAATPERDAAGSNPGASVAVAAVPNLESLPSVSGARLTAEQRRGQAAYDAFCWTCHGLYGHGDGPAARGFRQELPELARVASRFPAEEIVRRMRRPPEGAAADAGPAVWHALGIDEVRAAVAYIGTFAPPGSRGNPAAGRLIYATYCVHCHGTHGAGDGRLAHTLSAPPADLRSLDFLHQAQQAFAKLKAGTAQHGSFMPRWGRVFGDQQLWDVIAYLPALSVSR